MPYNYPLLLPLIEELKMDSKAKNSHSWRLRLEKYLATMPSYYVQVSFSFAFEIPVYHEVFALMLENGKGERGKIMELELCYKNRGNMSKGRGMEHLI